MTEVTAESLAAEARAAFQTLMHHTKALQARGWTVKLWEIQSMVSNSGAFSEPTITVRKVVDL